MSIDITIRWIEEDDISDVLEAEYKSNTHLDPDFEVEVTAPWTVGRAELMASLRKYKDAKRGERSTYTVVATIPVEVVEPNGRTGTMDWVCGAVTYEKHPEGWSVEWFAIHPSCLRESILRAFCQHLRNNATRSKHRKHVVMYLRDCDQAGIREFLPALKSEGWTISLARNHYENGMDGWKCELFVHSEAEAEGGEAQKMA